MNYQQLISNMNRNYNQMARLRARIHQNQKDIIVKAHNEETQNVLRPAIGTK